jgi:hypothetical protein
MLQVLMRFRLNVKIIFVETFSIMLLPSFIFKFNDIIIIEVGSQQSLKIQNKFEFTDVLVLHVVMGC